LIRGTQLYFSAKEAAAQLELSKESYQSLVEIRDLVKERYEKGLRPSLDYRLSETSVATSIVSIENRKSLLRSLNRQIETLMGSYPSGTFIKKSKLPIVLPTVPAGIPASVIERRPDVRSLVLKMEAAGHRVAQSKRNLLPGIAINGSAGTSTQEFEKIIDKEHGIWNLGMNVTAPIFNGGRLRSIVKIQESAYENARQDLIKGILNAFSEIEQFLEQNESLMIQNEALKVAVKQSKDAYDLSKERYDKGVTTLESVLNSQRQYNTIRSQSLTLLRRSIENRLSLVLAMGGDFDIDAEKIN
jgi:outer membrane protein TolC